MLIKELLYGDRLRVPNSYRTVVVSPIGVDNNVVFLLSGKGAFDYRKLSKFRLKIVHRYSTYVLYFKDDIICTFNCPPSIHDICMEICQKFGFFEKSFESGDKAYFKFFDNMIKETQFFKDSEKLLP